MLPNCMRSCLTYRKEKTTWGKHLFHCHVHKNVILAVLRVICSCNAAVLALISYLTPRTSLFYTLLKIDRKKRSFHILDFKSKFLQSYRLRWFSCHEKSISTNMLYSIQGGFIKGTALYSYALHIKV